jgi:hypothetical protein
MDTHSRVDLYQYWSISSPAAASGLPLITSQTVRSTNAGGALTCLTVFDMDFTDLLATMLAFKFRLVSLFLIVTIRSTAVIIVLPVFIFSLQSYPRHPRHPRPCRRVPT